MEIDRERRITRSMLIIQAYRGGAKVADIAEMYECSPKTVLRLARFAGLAKRPKAIIPVSTVKRALVQLRLKRSLREIADELKVSQGFLSQLARRNGLARYKR
jgi:hypothetical protein